MPNLYKDYFDIDPKYFPQVTESLIKEGKVSWKSYFSNDSFVEIIKQTCEMVVGPNNLSMFTWGPYGSGKSHLLLTLISMLNASNEEVKEYFAEQKLSNDLLNKFLTMKSSGKIITIHRIGSANIVSETDLILAVQQSVMAALKENGIENQGEASMKDSFLKWVYEPENQAYFKALIAKEKYAFDFSGMTVEDIISNLEKDNGISSEELMRKIMIVLKDVGQYGIFKDANSMSEWIKDIIDKNNLKAIIFAWDEFSEFLLTHPMGLTGFQTLTEISLSHPFYFIIVTHEAEKVFADAKATKKFLDRFQKPVEISLPENTAFKLLNSALKITNDPVLSKEWNEKIKPAVNSDLISVRKTILGFQRTSSGKKSAFSDEDLQGVVPIHPYAALVLRQIASMFNSNQRSMFDFVISENEDSKGFKWFIKNYGPFHDDMNILTVDLLWDFFCGKQVNGLSDDVRGIFLSYNGLKSEHLRPEEQRVLKTILILQAVSVRIANDDLLSPNSQTLDLAFKGTDWNTGKALAITRGLIEKGLVFEKPMANGKKEFCVANGNVDDGIKKYKEQAIAETKTSALITDAKLIDAVPIPAPVKKRYVVEATSAQGFQMSLNNHAKKNPRERIKTIITFAMNDIEMQQIKQQIMKNINMPNNEIVFIETLTPMGTDLYNQYIDSIAFSRYYTGKNKDQASHYQNQAESVLRQWSQNISNGAFVIYTEENKNGERKANIADLQEALLRMNQQKYPCCLEQYSLNSSMYDMFNLAQGAELGIKQELKGAFSNANKKISIENALDGAWNVEKYWEDPSKQSLVIVKVKKKIDEIVRSGFESGSGEISILSIFDEMEKPPFGFMPTAITAFVLGFTLKEYATADYFWSNHLNSETMTIDKMKTMIGNALIHRHNEVKNYKNEYIVTMTVQMRTFLKETADIFEIPIAQCTSIEGTRDQIRIKMKNYQFPIWCIKYILDINSLSSSKSLVESVIDDYSSIANTANGNKENESVLAERIGRTFIENPAVIVDLKNLINNNNCRTGMLSYIEQYKGGELKELARDIEDNGNYIEEVRKKFNAGDGNWVWNTQTADDRISDVILEYKIIQESNKSLSKCTSLKEIYSEWNARTSNIKIPCEAIAKQVGDLGIFLWQLSALKRNGSIAEQDKQKFYDILCEQREAFDTYYRDQVPYFKVDANSLLTDLSDDEIAEIYNSLPPGQFTKGKTEYYNFLQHAIDEYVQSQWKKKMQNMWQEKTGTKSPAEWSQKYITPILCMFDDDKRAEARKNFSIIMSSNPSESDAKAAIDFIENADFYDRLKSDDERNQMFMERVVGSNAIILKDVYKIREELLGKVDDAPYYWMDNSSVQSRLKSMVDKEYKLHGSEEAKQIIDNMDAAQLREYLKRRITDDAEFGLQILKGEVKS